MLCQGRLSICSLCVWQILALSNCKGLKQHSVLVTTSVRPWKTAPVCVAPREGGRQDAALTCSLCGSPGANVRERGMDLGTSSTCRLTS